MEVLNFGKSFEEYLLLRVGVSKNTIKFYRSDFNYFVRWFLLRIRLFGFFAQDIESALPYLTGDEAQNYKAYMEESQTPTRSINRRLSTLRQMSRFLLEQRLFSFNFMEGVTNSGIKSVSKTTLLSQNRLKHLFSISNIIKFGLIEVFLVITFLILLRINPSLNPWAIINKIQINQRVK